MTWNPSPNPGGQNRKLIRTTLKAWIDAQQVAGLDFVYPGEPSEWQFDDKRRAGSGYACLVGIVIAHDDEDRTAYTGPADPGGKMAHYDVDLIVRHITYNADEASGGITDEDERDRVIEALKDCLRGQGRDLGRPDVVLAAGEEPRQAGISTTYDPMSVDGSIVWRDATISFRVSQYIRPAA